MCGFYINEKYGKKEDYCVVMYGVRVVVEIGVDMIKIYWMGLKEIFVKVVDVVVGVLVFFSGGVKIDNFVDFLKVVWDVIEVGGVGVVVGRNIF